MELNISIFAMAAVADIRRRDVAPQRFVRG
jgi:hypothetical protein